MVVLAWNKQCRSSPVGGDRQISASVVAVFFALLWCWCPFPPCRIHLKCASHLTNDRLHFLGSVWNHPTRQHRNALRLMGNQWRKAQTKRLKSNSVSRPLMKHRCLSVLSGWNQLKVLSHIQDKTMVIESFHGQECLEDCRKVEFTWSNQLLAFQMQDFHCNLHPNRFNPSVDATLTQSCLLLQCHSWGKILSLSFRRSLRSADWLGDLLI